MKSTVEVMREVLVSCEGSEIQEDVNANTFIDTNMKEIQQCMRLYAQEAVQEFVEMETGEDGCVRIVGACISTDQDKLNKFKEELT